jgi:hypothetical protein
MKSLMRCLSSCKDLLYRDQPSSYDDSCYNETESFEDSCYNETESFEDSCYNETESFEDNVIRDRLLNEIIALADVAKDKSFTADTDDRTLLSDIFTEIFIKAHGINTFLKHKKVERPFTRAAKSKSDWENNFNKILNEKK